MITAIRKEIENDIFDYQQLISALADLRKPRDKITKLLDDGTIIRVKKGLYCFGDALRRRPISREYLANIIFGPSYISFHFALSYYGLIPERVVQITSASTGRSRQFTTPLGTFHYQQMKLFRYSCGIDWQQTGKDSFLIASVEKALVDTVYSDKQFSGLYIKEFNDYLSEGLRIETVDLVNLDIDLLRRIGSVYKSRKISSLVRFIERLGIG